MSNNEHLRHPDVEELLDEKEKSIKPPNQAKDLQFEINPDQKYKTIESYFIVDEGWEDLE